MAHRAAMAVLGVVVLTVLSAAASAATGHLGPGGGTAIGEYRVVLDDVRVHTLKASRPFVITSPVWLYLRTTASAQTHAQEQGAFGPYAGVRVDATVPVGKLVYWHLDCAPTEALKLLVQAGFHRLEQDVKVKVSHEAAGVLRSRGIVTDPDPELGVPAVASGDRLHELLDGAFSKMTPLRENRVDRIEMGSKPVTETFVPLSSDFSVTATFSYVRHPVTSCDDETRTKVAEQIAAHDAEVAGLLRRVADPDHDGYATVEETSAGTSASNANSAPTAPARDGVPANGDIALPTRTLPLAIELNGGAYWKGKLAVHPTLSRQGSRLRVALLNSATVSVTSAAVGCKSPPGSISSCIDEWADPYQRITDVWLTFDRGGAQHATGRNDFSVTVPPGARSIVNVEARFATAAINWVAHGSADNLTIDDKIRVPALLEWSGPRLAGL